ncbi:hypothetical protein ACFL1E_07010, partial [Candidatus Omnitrophota bacterium]
MKKQSHNKVNVGGKGEILIFAAWRQKRWTKVMSALVALIFLLNTCLPAYALRPGNYGQASSFKSFANGALSGAVTSITCMISPVAGTLSTIAKDITGAYMYQHHYDTYNKEWFSFKLFGFWGPKIKITKGQGWAMIVGILVGAAAGGIEGALSESQSEVYEELGEEVISEVLQESGEAATNAAVQAAAQGAVTGTVQAAAAGGISGLMNSVISGIVSVFSSIWNFLFNSLGFSSLLKQVKASLAKKAAKEAAKKAVEKTAKEAAKNAMGAGVAGAASQAAGNIFSRVLGLIGGAIKTATWDLLVWVGQTVWSGVTAVWSSVTTKSFWKNLGGNIANGAKSIFWDIPVNFVKGLVKSFVNTFKAFGKVFTKQFWTQFKTKAFWGKVWKNFLGPMGGDKVVGIFKIAYSAGKALVSAIEAVFTQSPIESLKQFGKWLTKSPFASPDKLVNYIKDKRALAEKNKLSNPYYIYGTQGWAGIPKMFVQLIADIAIAFYSQGTKEALKDYLEKHGWDKTFAEMAANEFTRNVTSKFISGVVLTTLATTFGWEVGSTGEFQTQGKANAIKGRDQADKPDIEVNGGIGPNQTTQDSSTALDAEEPAESDAQDGSTQGKSDTAQGTPATTDQATPEGSQEAGIEVIVKDAQGNISSKTFKNVAEASEFLDENKELEIIAGKNQDGETVFTLSGSQEVLNPDSLRQLEEQGLVERNEEGEITIVVHDRLRTEVKALGATTGVWTEGQLVGMSFTVGSKPQKLSLLQLAQGKAILADGRVLDASEAEGTDETKVIGIMVTDQDGNQQLVLVDPVVMKNSVLGKIKSFVSLEGQYLWRSGIDGTVLSDKDPIKAGVEAVRSQGLGWIIRTAATIGMLRLLKYSSSSNSMITKIWKREVSGAVGNMLGLAVDNWDRLGWELAGRPEEEDNSTETAQNKPKDTAETKATASTEADSTTTESTDTSSDTPGDSTETKQKQAYKNPFRSRPEGMPFKQFMARAMSQQINTAIDQVLWAKFAERHNLYPGALTEVAHLAASELASTIINAGWRQDPNKGKDLRFTPLSGADSEDADSENSDSEGADNADADNQGLRLPDIVAKHPDGVPKDVKTEKGAFAIIFSGETTLKKEKAALDQKEQEARESAGEQIAQLDAEKQEILRSMGERPTGTINRKPEAIREIEEQQELVNNNLAVTLTDIQAKRTEIEQQGKFIEQKKGQDSSGNEITKNGQALTTEQIEQTFGNNYEIKFDAKSQQYLVIGTDQEGKKRTFVVHAEAVYQMEQVEVTPEMQYTEMVQAGTNSDGSPRFVQKSDTAPGSLETVLGGNPEEQNIKKRELATGETQLVVTDKDGQERIFQQGSQDPELDRRLKPDWTSTKRAASATVDNFKESFLSSLVESGSLPYFPTTGRANRDLEIRQAQQVQISTQLEAMAKGASSIDANLMPLANQLNQRASQTFGEALGAVVSNRFMSPEYRSYAVAKTSDEKRADEQQLRDLDRNQLTSAFKRAADEKGMKELAGTLEAHKATMRPLEKNQAREAQVRSDHEKEDNKLTREQIRLEAQIQEAENDSEVSGAPPDFNVRRAKTRIAKIEVEKQELRADTDKKLAFLEAQRAEIKKHITPMLAEFQGQIVDVVAEHAPRLLGKAVLGTTAEEFSERVQLNSPAVREALLQSVSEKDRAAAQEVLDLLDKKENLNSELAQA